MEPEFALDIPTGLQALGSEWKRDFVSCISHLEATNCISMKNCALSKMHHQSSSSSWRTSSWQSTDGSKMPVHGEPSLRNYLRLQYGNGDYVFRDEFSFLAWSVRDPELYKAHAYLQ